MTSCAAVGEYYCIIMKNRNNAGSMAPWSYASLENKNCCLIDFTSFEDIFFTLDTNDVAKNTKGHTEQEAQIIKRLKMTTAIYHKL